MIDARNRFPWDPDELAFLASAKAQRISHKAIARRLQRTPRAIDQKWALLKQRAEELELLGKVMAESLKPEMHPEGGR